ncbi:tryptophan aminotransferase of Arabidopsis 1, partial [Prunus dulcis]
AQSSSYFVILALSIAVNLLLVFQFCVDGEWRLTWSKRAAEEAERVAAIPCSGHGTAYLDGLFLMGRTSPDCSEFVTECAANADSGDPYFLQPFWMQHAAQITQGRYIVFGAGSTQLLNAAVHALSSHNSSNSSSPASVVATIPYYRVRFLLYKTQTEFFRSLDYRFEETHPHFLIYSEAGKVIEFVTSPNNPDGKLNKAVLHGPNASAIYDRVYYWPHFTAIPNPADDDLMLFSFPNSLVMLVLDLGT